MNLKRLFGRETRPRINKEAFAERVIQMISLEVKGLRRLFFDCEPYLRGLGVWVGNDANYVIKSNDANVNRIQVEFHVKKNI